MKKHILLKNQSENIEFASHLHAEFINPERLLFHNNMGKKYADKFQTEYPPEIEYLKLQNLTDNFYNKEASISIMHNDIDLQIEWPVSNPILSPNDINGLKFSELYTD